MAVYYICSLPNRGEPGGPHELFTDNLQATEEFARREDKPGRGVFDCVSLLKNGATRRGLDTVEEVHKISVDIDFKDIIEDANEVDRRLAGMAVKAATVTDSGHGRHVTVNLKEPADDPDAMTRADTVRKRLTAYLCGDRAVAHAAALLRRPGRETAPSRPRRNGSSLPASRCRMATMLAWSPSGNMPPQ